MKNIKENMRTVLKIKTISVLEGGQNCWDCFWPIRRFCNILFEIFKENKNAH